MGNSTGLSESISIIPSFPASPSSPEFITPSYSLKSLPLFELPAPFPLIFIVPTPVVVSAPEDPVTWIPSFPFVVVANPFPFAIMFPPPAATATLFIKIPDNIPIGGVGKFLKSEKKWTAGRPSRPGSGGGVQP